MRLILCLFFLLPTLGHAQVRSSYFLYDTKKINLDDRSFERYIIPQLKAITQEFYHILKKLHPIHDSTIKLFLQLSNTERTFKKYHKKCKEIDDECFENLKELYGQSRKLDQLIMEPQNNLVKLTNTGSSHELEGMLHLISGLGQMGNQNYRLMHALEEYILTANTSFFPFYDGKSLIEPTIHKMLLSSELMLTQLLEGELRDDFHAVWIHFFKEVDEKILYQKDKIYLIKRLEELNLSWNTFHMKMTKGNHNLPQNIVGLIKIMHNRWNSCLKIILR
ncbi:MAG: hypothetical protein K9K67_05905 [Bacteriovoracaceae bacterium]|nr:hypothetical protein [Bacteriovoracaceae bacterium]